MPKPTFEDSPTGSLGKYGTMFRDHLKRHRPRHYQQLLRAGELRKEARRVQYEVSRQVADGQSEMTHADPPPKEMGFLAKAAYLGRHARTAEEIALAEMVYLPPESEENSPDETTESPMPTSSALEG